MDQIRGKASNSSPQPDLGRSIAGTPAGRRRATGLVGERLHKGRERMDEVADRARAEGPVEPGQSILVSGQWSVVSRCALLAVIGSN